MSSPEPQQIDTPSNHGPIVGVMTWFFLAATVCAVIARIATKLAISRRLTNDDFLIFAALVSGEYHGYQLQLLMSSQGSSIGQGVLVTLQIANGLGKHTDTLSPSQLDHFDKYDYASNLLFIINLCFAKVSVLQMLRIITPIKQHVRMVLGVGVFVLLWSVLAAIVVQMVYQDRAKGSSDRTFMMWPVVLCAQAVQSLSIITACIPCLKPFLESLESGMIRVDDLRRRGMNGTYGYGSHNLSNLSSLRSNGKKEKSQLGSNGSGGKHYKLPNNISTVVSVKRNEEAERDSDSQKSSARIIKYTRTFSVE
ncbi:MAG: hypothetical protein Q9169_001054 [Polycauliona sp. 2 TL-2023]